MVAASGGAGAEGDPILGRQLGDFVVRERIGAGGFGAVYRAEQPGLGRHAVIKVPLAGARKSAEYVARFLREARLASKLDHPYAAHIYAFGSEPDGTLWTAMELVRGTPLDRLLAQQGPLPVDRFLALFDKICEVVHTAHEQGIVHRDLKPANVMVLARAGQLLPKLLDLGIAKVDEAAPAPPRDDADALSEADSFAPPQAAVGADVAGDVVRTRQGRSLGSPAYMAPEQWVDARRADARADIYALGVLAFEALTGHLPFQASTVPQMALAHASATPPPMGGDVPPALDAVVRRAMAKKPEERFASALDLSAAFRAAVGLDQVAPPLPTLATTLRDRLVGYAPQPLAESVAAMDGVRGPYEAQRALFQVARVTARLLGGIALAAWVRRGADRATASPKILATLRELRRHGLPDQEWLELAREVALHFLAQRDACPVPELVDWFFPDGMSPPSGPDLAAGSGAVAAAVTTTISGSLQAVGRASDGPRMALGSDERAAVTPPIGAADLAHSDALQAVLALKTRFDEGLAADEPTTLRLVTAMVPLASRFLEGLGWLDGYTVAVTQPPYAEHWMGARRSHRQRTALRSAAVAEPGHVVLLDADSVPVLDLWPLVQALPPAPGHAPELFVLEGGQRGGARLVSLPTGFECTDQAVWPWLGETVELGADEQARRGDERPPYRGLAAFTQAEADGFVGREREAEAFANRLRVTSLLAVVGPSGAGKSSFIQAGVMPLLGPTWTSLIVRPGGSPLTALQALLAPQLAGGDATAPSDVLGDGLGQLLRQRARDEGRNILLYVDQFEELFTLCHDAAERERYVDALVRAAREPDDPVRVVLTVRDDFLLRCQEVVALRDRLAAGLQLLATPTPDDLLRILVEPARRAGYEYEDDDLPREMVAALADVPAALPLLSFTAAQLWELRDRHLRRLTRNAYTSLGGVGGALAQHAERVLGRMSEVEQPLVRVAFRNLVTAEGTRAILTRDELLQLLGGGAAAPSVIEQLIGARLLTASEGAGGHDRVEVVHEALLSAWPRLLDWRREDAEGARLRDQLRAAARQWHERGRPRGLLWRAEALTEYQLWRARQPGALTELERAFAAASERDAVRWRRIRNATIATIGTLLTVGMVVALVLYRRAEAQRARARALAVQGFLSQGQRAAVSGDANQAMVYLAAARAGGARGDVLDVPLATVRATMNAEQMVYRGHQNKIWAMELLPGGAGFVTAGADGVVNVWDLGARTPRWTNHDSQAGIFSVAVSTDGQWLAVPSKDGHVRLYRTADGQRVYDWTHGTGEVWWARFAGAPLTVVALGIDGSATTWDVATGAPAGPFSAAPDGAGTPAVSPDGTTLAVPTFNGGIQLWRVADRTLVRSLTGHHTGVVWATAFSPDGALLATAGSDRVINLWDVATGEVRATLVGHTAAVEELRFSPDGQRLASGGRDASIRIWNRHGELQQTLQAPRGTAYCERWSPDGTRLLACVGDAATLWDVGTALPLARFQGHGATVFRADFVRDGAEVITTGFDGASRRWAVSPPTRVMPTAHADEVVRTATCDAGQGWLTVGRDGVARGWTRDGRSRWRSPEGWTVADAACAASDARVVLARDDGDVYVLDPASGAPTHVPRAPGLGRDPRVALAPGGARLAIVDGTGAAAVLELDGRPPLALAPAGPAPGDGAAIAWSADGSTVVASTTAGAVVWDARTGVRRFAVPPPGGELRQAAIDETSASLFVVGADYDVQRLALADGHLEASYRNDAFPWSVVTSGAHVFVGLDDGSVVDFDRDSGRRLGLRGFFSSDVVALAPAGPSKLWVSTSDRTLALLDRTSAAVLFRTGLPDEGGALASDGDLGVLVGGDAGAVTLVQLARDDASPARLADELACRVPYTLNAGLLTMRAPDVAACARLEPHPPTPTP